MKFEWLSMLPAKLNQNSQQAATERQLQLTKPPEALGELEGMAITLAAMQGNANPNIEKIMIAVFAADHGVAANNVSAFPQAVTTEMVKNFAHGGAAINVLARAIDAKLEVINLGTIYDPGPLPEIIDRRIAAGTQDFSQRPAMSEEELFTALNVGRQTAERAAQNQMQLFIGGEMGIGNTTAATAIACALLKVSAAKIAGRGTGLDDKGLHHKISLIDSALKRHNALELSATEILRHYGGFEIAGLTGSYLACAKMGMPVLVDGFITTVAALCAERICPGSADWFLYAHKSAEQGHRFLLENLNAKPILHLGLRLGEASGAASAVPLLQLACKLHNQMATFAEAEVSGKL